MVVAKLLVSDGRLHYITQSSLLMWAVRPSQTSTVSQRWEQWTDSTWDDPGVEIGRFVFLQQQSLDRSTSMLALVSRTGLKFVIYNIYQWNYFFNSFLFHLSSSKSHYLHPMPFKQSWRPPPNIIQCQYCRKIPYQRHQERIRTGD